MPTQCGTALRAALRRSVARHSVPPYDAVWHGTPCRLATQSERATLGLSTASVVEMG